MTTFVDKKDFIFESKFDDFNPMNRKFCIRIQHVSLVTYWILYNSIRVRGLRHWLFVFSFHCWINWPDSKRKFLSGLILETSVKYILILDPTIEFVWWKCFYMIKCLPPPTKKAFESFLIFSSSQVGSNFKVLRIIYVHYSYHFLTFAPTMVQHFNEFILNLVLWTELDLGI